MKDPLAGKRQAINDRRTTTLTWPDRGSGSPVQVGDVEELRSCAIEITKVERKRHGRTFVWIAHFTRIERSADKPYLLTRGQGNGRGYSRQPGEGMDSCDTPEPPTLIVFSPSDRRPEPEAVPPHEIPSYTGSALSRARFDAELAERRMELAAKPPGERLDTMRELARRNHVDLSSDERVIERRLDAMAAKLQRAA